jgi:phthiocerol/phenolphthiocerol synthesis type-I polyketide synthase B
MSADPVAIVGIGCRFPGGVVDPQTFWQLLIDGRDAVGDIPADRIDIARFFDERPATPGRMMSRHGGFLDGIDMFDAAFFGISPREAERLDPQQRLLLETAWEAIEDAGVDAAGLVGSATGVFVGQWISDFESRLFSDPRQVDFMMTTGSGRYAASGRLSYALGLRGPSLTIDTACSSSLVAVHLAVRALRGGECSLALAGGVNVILQPHISVAYSQSRMMAPDGRCKFGDARADGYVRSEGAGIVALKRLDDAVADGDRIYAVVRGSAVNNDGRGSGSMGTPSVDGQEALLHSAYADAAIDPAEVGYFEAHGTGTRAGDPVELAALGRVLGKRSRRAKPWWVGSLKTNIGHTEGAAGVAGLIKAALVVHHGQVPASLHLAQPNPDVPWDDLPLRVPASLCELARGDGRRAAAVSSFGIAGTNAHVVLEAGPSAATAVADAECPTVLPLSARCPEALRALAGRYARWLEQRPATPLAALCHAAATRRTALECRASFAADNRAALVQALHGHAAGEDAGAARATAHGTDKPRIVFVCPGQGAQWAGMVQDLLRHDAGFDASVRRCDEAARPWLDVSMRDLLLADPAQAATQLERIDVVQPVLVALSIAYAEWLRAKGIVPDAVVGHSMGEVAAAHVAGALSLSDAMRIVCRRSALMRSTSGRGAMALVDLPMADAQARLAHLGARVAVAVNNSPRSCVISGEPQAVRDVMQTLEAEQIFCRLINVDVASHSPQMDAPAAALAAELAGLEPRDLRTTMVSTTLGRICAGHELGASHWARNLRHPVRFAEAVQQLCGESTAGDTVFIELGPHPVLLPAVQQTAQAVTARGAGAPPVHTVACGRRDEPAATTLLGATGALWTLGAKPDWGQVCGLTQPSVFVDLPKYPWQRERHWATAAELPQHGPSAQSATRPSDEALGWLQAPAWLAQGAPTARGAPTSCLVTGDDATATALLAEGLQASGWAAHCAALDALGAALMRAPSPQAVVVLLSDSPSAAQQPLRALQALLAARVGSRLWFVTRGAQALDAKEVPAVHAAAAWGSARVIAEEHPEIWGGLVDLDPMRPLEQAARDLHRELLAADGEDQIGWRGPQRRVLRWVASESSGYAPGAAPWRADSTVLVTGGLGGVGLHLARALVAAGARRLALLGRRALPPRDAWRDVPPASAEGQRIAAVLELEAAGAAVHIAAVDVRDERALGAFLDGWRREAWPPIRAVVHAAGTMHNALAAEMDAATFDAVQQPKLNAALHLDRLLPELDLYVLVSSTGAWLAQPGQANYAAANAGLDALAQARRARGQPTLSIGWGVWRDTGLVNNVAGATHVAEMARQGIASFTPEQGRTLFGWLCAQAAARGLTHVAVLPIDWNAHARARGGRIPGWLRARTTSEQSLGASGASIGERLTTASADQRLRLLESIVRDAVGQVLKLNPSRIDARKTLGSMGLSSLLAMELRNRLEAALQRPLSATLAWNHPTVEALAAHLAQDAAGAPSSAETSAPAAAAVAVDLAAVADLSDEEAALALRTRRSGGRR